jgi:superfamily II DNA or RNA helicase
MMAQDGVPVRGNSAPLGWLTKGAILKGPYWPEPISIVSHFQSSHGFVAVEAVGLDTRQHYTTTLPSSVWETLRAEGAEYTFNAPAQPFRLALEAERLRLAYAADPLLAANNARVHLLPHQIEAVYGYMLPQPRIRHLMAHDAGAGKTIMGGLLYKELASRESTLRTLIVAPAALTVQWQREMREKFLVEFDVVDRDQLRGNGQIWSESPRLITSLPFARQADVVATLANVRWDLVIVDEAHHMAGYEKRETQAYRLGCILSQNTKHLVLATATPHKGDTANFLKMLQLLDDGIHDPGIVSHQLPGQRGTPLMLRRLKEEMVDFDGNDLFKPRQVETRWHAIGANPPEMALYTALTDYVSKTYRAAERIGGQVKVNTEFAMVILQRRMASSFAALRESLHRRREGLMLAIESLEPGMDWGELEEQPEGERWTRERQAELATPAKTAQEREKEIAQVDELLEKLEAVGQSGIETKMEALRQILGETGVSPGNGEKLLVFTEFKDTLDFLRGLFEGWGFSVTQIDGSMDHDLRRQAEADFCDTRQVMVATEAAGEGINLQFCATMVNYDLPWVPTRLEQRMGRIHRYGQKRVARIFNLVAADTREGQVLAGLLNRLEEMRTHLGDQVFDVVSALVSDAQVEKLMAQAATAPTTEASQDRALQTLIQAIEAGEARYRQWQEHPFAISTEQFRQMQQASRQSRLTPEYAQHFFVDVLSELHEVPVALEDVDQPAGDAVAFSVALRRNNIAQVLGLPTRKRQIFSFRDDATAEDTEARFLALGTDLFDRALRLVRERWGDALQRGAKFIDVDLPPGASYLLWFLATEVRDGLGQQVAGRLFAVKQTMEGLCPAAASSLIDLILADTFLIPETLKDLAQTPQPVIEWSINEQQLPFLQEVQQQREFITGLRQEPLLADAQAAVQETDRTYNELVFASFDADAQALRQAEVRREEAQARVAALNRQFEHEGACSLGPTRVVGVAAVFSLAEPPEQDLSDERPDVAAAAERWVLEYERRQKRSVRDVSGEHDKYPYDVHSTGPGGVRCIEVKGTTTGRIMLRENQRRAARRLGKSYFLYVVHDPLGEHPRLTIIRDPLSRLDHDEVLYSGARYVYNSTTWHAAADEEISL